MASNFLDLEFTVNSNLLDLGFIVEYLNFFFVDFSLIWLLFVFCLLFINFAESMTIFVGFDINWSCDVN